MDYDTREIDNNLLGDEYAPLVLEMVPFDDSPNDLDVAAMFDDNDDPFVEEIDLDFAPEIEF